MKTLISKESASEIGLASAVLAYTIWGIAPLFWKRLGEVSPIELLAHRMVWGWLFLLVLPCIPALRGSFVVSMANNKQWLQCAISGLFLSTTWLIFVYAITEGRLVEASFGFFVVPLLSAIVGRFLFNEKLTNQKWLGILVGIAAAVLLSLRETGFPWLGILLAFSFVIYALLRKSFSFEALQGTWGEMSIQLPIWIALLVWLYAGGESSIGTSASLNVMLLLSGVVTIAPLLLFVVASRSIPLSKAGFLQYLTPVLQLIVAVFVFGESVSTYELIGFGMIGVALFLFLMPRMYPGPISTD